MKSDKKFHHYVYEVENFVSEFAIAFTSFGAILVVLFTIFDTSTSVNWTTLGATIEPWVTMTALLLIVRELWIMNHDRHLRAKAQAEQEE